MGTVRMETRKYQVAAAFEVLADVEVDAVDEQEAWKEAHGVIWRVLTGAALPGDHIVVADAEPIDVAWNEIEEVS